jgi:uncharacterized protein HemX
MVQERDLAGQQAAFAGQQASVAMQQVARLEQDVGNLQKKMRAAAAASRPAPQFRSGQSVHHWWGTWFETAMEVPKLLNKKTRPKWYVSEVMERLFPTQSGL